MSDMRMSPAMTKILEAMQATPSEARYGYDLMKETGMASGTLYPALDRLEIAGQVVGEWCESELGTPRRRLYRLKEKRGLTHER